MPPNPAAPKPKKPSSSNNANNHTPASTDKKKKDKPAVTQKKPKPKVSAASTATIIHPPVIPPPLATYAEEIAKMMYTFGDVREPNTETVKLVELHTRKHILDLVQFINMLIFFFADI